MTRRKRRHTPEWQWQREQELTGAYYDFRWREVLDPLHEQLVRWKAGELAHDDADQAIHETHQQNQRVYRFFTQSRHLLVREIQWDREWFEPWAADHSPPPGTKLVPMLGRPPFAAPRGRESDDETP